MKQQVIEVLKAHLKSNERELQYFRKLEKALSPHVGKTVTMRWKKYFPAGFEMYRDDNGRYYARIGGIRFHIAGGKTNRITYYVSSLRDLNPAYTTGNEERVTNLKDMLSDPEKIETIAAMLEKVKAAVQTLREANDARIFSAIVNPASNDLFILACFPYCIRGRLWPAKHEQAENEKQLNEFLSKNK